VLPVYEREVTVGGRKLEQKGGKGNLNEAACGVQVRDPSNTALDRGLELEKLC